MNKIVAVQHEKDGTLKACKLDDGRVLNMSEAADLASIGELEGVSTFTTRDGDQAIRSDRGQKGYKLQDLPEFE